MIREYEKAKRKTTNKKCIARRKLIDMLISKYGYGPTQISNLLKVKVGTINSDMNLLRKGEGGMKRKPKVATIGSILQAQLAD